MQKIFATFEFLLMAILLLVTGTGSGVRAEPLLRHVTPQKNFLSPAARESLQTLMVQDYQGRMKPLDTLSRELTWKIVKRGSFEGWEPIDFYVSLMAHPKDWINKPIIAVRHEGLKKLLGVPPASTHVTPVSLFDQAGHYRLVDEVEKAHRTADKKKTKVQRKLLSLDERVNLFNMTVRQLTFRVFPLPGDENNRWISPAMVGREMTGGLRLEYEAAFNDLSRGLQRQDSELALRGARRIHAIQKKYGAEVLPSQTAMSAELLLNRYQVFMWVTIPYLVAFGLLMVAYAWSLFRSPGVKFSLRHPLYALGMAVFLTAVAAHAFGYVLRWIAAGHAPLSNGYESLIFISLMTGVAGLFYELRSRRASMAGLAALLTSVILGVAMLPTFDAAISPLAPVLSSAWLIIHVMVITASYAFLGLAALVAMTMLVLYLFKGPGRANLQMAIYELNALHWRVVVAGLAFLSVGTFLGGVWANESWGRYWGWDPKETWSLVTILVYAFVVHFRFIVRLNSPLNLAAGSFLSIASVGMTYFGVNYFLSGLHSYAQGDTQGVPGWVYVMAAAMIGLVVAACAVDGSRSWERQQR